MNAPTTAPQPEVLARKASPGGSADLLAASLFLHAVTANAHPPIHA